MANITNSTSISSTSLRTPIVAKYRADGSLILKRGCKIGEKKYHIVINLLNDKGVAIKTDGNSRFCKVALGEVQTAACAVFKTMANPTKVKVVYNQPDRCFVNKTPMGPETNEFQQMKKIYDQFSCPKSVGVSLTAMDHSIVPSLDKLAVVKTAPQPPAVPKSSAPEVETEIDLDSISVASTPRSVLSHRSLVCDELPITDEFSALNAVPFNDGKRDITYADLAAYSYRKNKTDKDDLWNVYQRYVAFLSKEVKDEVMNMWVNDLIQAATDYYNHLPQPVDSSVEAAEHLVFGHISI